MGEIKSVKVDNWGVFFLQKLQNFFNKTDYCDLTLQFRDNSQLKVHRLVLSACTDYFNVLEQTCEVIDDALIMPNELQADVVVPIVNFMYTGTLEFELKMYGKLLRTAKEMNMTVLLKLLEAHRRTMENVNRAQRPPSPKAIRRRGNTGVQTVSTVAQQYQNQAQQTRAANTNVGNMQRRIVQTKAVGTSISPGVQVYRQQIGSTSVVRTSSLKANQNQQSLQSYIKNESGEYETITTTQPTSPFEQLRKGYNNNKRPAVTTFSSPPTKKPNLEDVKEFAEQQRMRKQIAAEYGEDQEFEGMMDDDIHNDDDDDDGAATGTGVVNAPTTHSLAVTTSNIGPQENIRNTSITFKHEHDGQPPTIIVKDSSGSKLNHAKIISEVLRQYPHLAKGNKNIKLKIMPNATGQAQRIVIKKEPEQPVQLQPVSQQISKSVVGQQNVNLPTQLISSEMIIKSGDRVISQVPQTTNAAAKSITTTTQKSVAPTTTTSISTPVVDNTQQKRRIDSKTMHALIALGAENMTGPWLCLRCGVNGRPISIPSYRGFRRHLINTHKESIDPALCEHCGWRSHTNRELHFHMQTEHKIKTTLYTFPECVLCVEMFLDTNALNQHMLDSHPSANKQQCIYCNKIFVKEMQLYTHMKLYHKHQALEDGIIDASDEEFGLHGDSEDGENMDVDSDRELQKSETISTTEHRDGGKVKILSDISLPMASSIIKLDNDNININTIDAQTKFVTADGNEMILTDEQRTEIISQLNQDHNNGGVVMVLQEAIFPSGDTVSTAASVEEASTASARVNEMLSEEELDDNQIYDNLSSSQNVSLRHKTDKQQNENKEVLDNLEWAENLISEHDLTDTGGKSATKKDDEDNTKKDDISQKLKELTGDWSEDENEEEGSNADIEKAKSPIVETENNTTEEKANTDLMEMLPTESEKETIDSADDKSCSSKKSTNENAPKQTIPDENATQSEIKKEKDQIEHDNVDELELTMKNLHEGNNIKMEEKISNEGGLPSLDEDIKMDIDNVKKEVDIVEPQMESNAEANAITNTTTTSGIVDHSTELLDELMSTTKGSNLDADKHKIVDDFDEAELNDVEEFTSLDKNEQQQSTTNIAIVQENKTTVSNQTLAKSNENIKVAEKNTASETTPVDVTKSLTSDWDDIEEDEDEIMDEAVGNDVE